MEKDNIKENQINSEVEETEVQALNPEITEVEINTDQQEDKEENANVELSKLINDDDSDVNESSCTKVILANILDQLLVLAGSAVLLLLCDLILRVFGYMFVKETGALVLAGGIIYFIINCIYAPVMEKSKLKNTIAKKILNIKA